MEGGEHSSSWGRSRDADIDEGGRDECKVHGEGKQANMRLAAVGTAVQQYGAVET